MISLVLSLLDLHQIIIQKITKEESSTISSGSYSVEDETESYLKNINTIHKRYSIQDVIKPGQIILVQVLKEERGNKGAL